MKKLSFNSITRKQQSKCVFIEVIQKSWYRHLSVSFVTGNGIAKNKFYHQNFFFKVEYLCSFLWLVMVSVPLCYKYLVLYDFLSIKSKASIGVLEKSLLNIRKHPSWCFKKNNCSKNFCILCILSSETSKFEFFLSTLVGFPRITPKSSLEQLFCRHRFIRAIQMSVIYFKKLELSLN